MEKLCKSCKHWQEKLDDENKPKNVGRCLSIKIIEAKFQLTPTDGVGYWSPWADGMDQYCILETGENFGCIHHEYKETKLTFDNQCDDDICLSCGS